MENAIMAADEIFNVALQILNERQLDAKLVPLVMGAVSHRLDAFAIGEMARELSGAKRQPETTESEE